jgi:hypothetical protein
MMTKKWLIALILFTPPISHAQGNELIVGLSLHASSLSGVVVAAGDGTPFPKAKVSRIECGKGEFRGTIPPVILQTIETDANGNFAFPWKNHGRTCLQVQTPGMDLLQVEVGYAKGGGKLKLELVVGS